ncbi:Nn.00g011590.m01.CDS01 [Neocucurbitaria sp. VM-36]
MARLMASLLPILWALLCFSSFTLATPLVTSPPSVAQNVPKEASLSSLDQDMPTSTAPFITDAAQIPGLLAARSEPWPVPSIMNPFDNTVTILATTTSTVYLYASEEYGIHKPTPAPLDWVCNNKNFRHARDYEGATGFIDCYGTYDALPFAFKRVSGLVFRSCHRGVDSKCFEPTWGQNPIIKFGSIKYNPDMGIYCQQLMKFVDGDPVGHQCWGTANFDWVFRYAKVDWTAFNQCVADILGEGCPTHRLRPVHIESTWRYKPTHFGGVEPRATMAPSHPQQISSGDEQ